MALPQGFGPRRSFADVQRQQLANQLLAQGGDASPVAHPMQGVARLAQALMGGYMTNRNEQRENDQQQAFSQAVTEAMQPQFVPGSAGAGPRSGPQGATMAPPSFGDVAQRLAANPATAHIAPQFQMMGLQQQAADAAKRADPMFGRTAVRGVGLVDMRGGTPQVLIPEQRPENQPRFAVHNIGGRAVAVNQSDPTMRNDLGPYGSPAAQASAGTPPPFGGTGIEAQHYNNLLTLPNNDPRYAVSFNALFGRRAVTQADGTTVEIQPPIPQGIQPPNIAQAAPSQQPAQAPVVAGGAASQAQGAAPNVSTVQTPGGATVTRIGSPREKDLSEAQARANLFGGQMREAEDILATTRVPSSVAIMAWRNLPESAVNLGLSRNDQQYFNALRLFAAGVLRKETGAAFTPNELLDVQSRYFPMPGDRPEVIEQKARSRRQVQESIRAEMPGGNFRGLLPEDEARAAAGLPRSTGGSPPPPPGFELLAPR